MAADPPPPRTRSVRLTLVSLLLFPLLSLAALWGFAASITLGNVIQNQHENTLVAAIGPAIIGLEQTLEPERALTVSWLSSDPRSARLRDQMVAARHGTDEAAAA